MSEHTPVPSGDRYRDLFDSSLDAILKIDRGGIILLASDEAERLFGYTHGELIGKSVDELVPGRFRARHAEHREGYAQAPRRRPMGSSLDLWARRKDGTEFPVDIKLGPAGSQEDPRVICVVRDITERRNAEKRIRDLNLELEQRYREVEKADRLKSEFLATFSHELRTPLNTIIGFASLLREQNVGELNAKQLRFVDHIVNGSQHLLALINDILDLSKIEAGRVDLQPEIFSPAESIEEVLATLRPAADQKGLRLEEHSLGTVRVSADRRHVRQILLNLLGNAVKFTPAGGEIRVEVSGSSDHCLIVVADNGIGIASDELERIFESFHQSAAASGKEGTGLGLAITKRLVELNHGSIRAESELGKGSRFVVALPLPRP